MDDSVSYAASHGITAIVEPGGSIKDQAPRLIRQTSSALRWYFLAYATEALVEETMATVLVIGAGAREHALAQAFANSAQVTMVYVAPGNVGMAELIRFNPWVFDDGYRRIA